MIVPMKKAVLFVLKREEGGALLKLKSLGVLHVDTVKRESSPLAELVAGKETLERALQALEAVKSKKRRAADAQPAGMEASLALAREVIAVRERLAAAAEEARKLDDELERLAPWGDFDPAAIKALRARGVNIGLYELAKKDLAELPAGVAAFPLARRSGLVCAVLASYAPGVEAPFREARLPAESTVALRRRLAGKRDEIGSLEAELEALGARKTGLERSLAQRSEEVEFEEVRLTFQSEPEILFLSGFLPAPEVEGLKAAAREEGWGIVVSDPGPDDDVPVLIRRPKPLRLIKPVFDFLGTVPGYREYDISLPFLAFFSVFIAMLIGDAGYGLLFIVFTFLGRVIFKKIPKSLFGLLLLTSGATVAWGVVTGTWFGSPPLAELPFLKALVIEPIATFSETDNRPLLMLICFVIGLVHITLAHLLSAIRNRKAFKGLAEIGRIALVWGMFFMVLYLVLQQPLHPIAVWLIGGGVALVFLFEQQTGPYGPGALKAILGFLRGVGKGFANLFLTGLSAVSTLADIISYVRLFAVGLAGVEIAKTFNGMAAAVDGGLGAAGMVFSILILFVGHALNMVLSLMSVLVHGVRLNMLEFSSHLGMEWSGREYKPFAFRGIERESTADERGWKRRKNEYDQSRKRRNFARA